MLAEQNKLTGETRFHCKCKAPSHVPLPNFHIKYCRAFPGVIFCIVLFIYFIYKYGEKKKERILKSYLLKACVEIVF